MRKIIVAVFTSIDGVVEAPENWTFPYFTNEIGQVIGGYAARTDSFLIGRVTYQSFEASFSGQTGGIADIMNNQHKYVVSTTLKKAEWQNSELISGDVMAQIAKLKQGPGKDMLVNGSPTLAQALISHNLVDEFSLLVYPVVLGSGKRLFIDGHNAKLKLAESKSFSSGVVHFSYQVEPAA